jgi:hypothetical protein
MRSEQAQRRNETHKAAKSAGERSPAPPPIRGADVLIGHPANQNLKGEFILGGDRLTFDGYVLTWHGAGGKSFTAFSGAPDERAQESVKDVGPTPQGKYTVDPSNIEELEPSDDWGEHRVRLEPLAGTVERMKDCFKLVRSGMYIHGGSQRGTHGCIELNDDSDEKDFFARLKKYGTPIELEVKYVGDREQKYEDTRCPY